MKLNRKDTIKMNLIVALFCFLPVHEKTEAPAAMAGKELYMPFDIDIWAGTQQNNFEVSKSKAEDAIFCWSFFYQPSDEVRYIDKNAKFTVKRVFPVGKHWLNNASVVDRPYLIRGDTGLIFEVEFENNVKMNMFIFSIDKPEASPGRIIRAWEPWGCLPFPHSVFIPKFHRRLPTNEEITHFFRFRKD